VAPRRGGGPAPLRPGEHGEHEDRRSPAPWSPEEDAKVKAYIEEHDTGGNWIALLQKIGMCFCVFLLKFVRCLFNLVVLSF